MRVRPALAIAAAGFAATTAASLAFQMPAGDAIRLAAIAGAGALGVGVLGTALLLVLRRNAIGVQVAVVALVSVAAVGVGAIAAARAMFISDHDLDTLLVILLAAGTVGALVAFVLGHRVSAAGRALGAMTRTIGTKAALAVPTTGTGEFAALARELEEMSARLEEGRARERAIDESRRELIAWVSHDLRTPLAGIRAVAEALEDGMVEEDPETTARYYRTVRIEAERLARLVDELFELSMIHAGALRLEIERVSLSDLVSDAVSAASAAARSRGVRVEGQVNGSPPELEAAPSAVARVLRNLLDNAIRHTPSDGSVWVQTGLEDGDAYVWVADQCGGIPESDLLRVFDVAFRGERARTPGTDGAGLGLAIARGIVEAHHGEITVCNDGPGCRFTVRLPLSQRPHPLPGRSHR
jgi:signal transduction histidine kinase